MSTSESRRWTDPRDRKKWTIHFNPAVELDNRRVRRSRERLIFEGDDEVLEAPAVYGSDLDSLSDEDLQGLVDQARRARSEEGAT